MTASTALRLDQLHALEHGFSVEEITMVGLRLCDLLEALHERGAVHGDVRPGNITTSEQAGVALGPPLHGSRLDERLARVAAPGQQRGFYLAPEQVAADGTSEQRTDQYGLGATLYFLATGRAPVNGRSPFEVLRRFSPESLTPPHDLNPQLPPPLGQLIMRLLAPNPADRFADLASVRELLVCPQPDGDPAHQTAGQPHALIDLDRNGRASTILLSKPPRWVHAMIYLFVLLIVTGFSWAYLSRVDTYITAPGVVVPDGNAIRVQTDVSGPLIRVAVRSGDRVTRGQLLFEIGRGGLETEVAKRRKQVLLHGARVTQLTQKIALQKRTHAARIASLSEKLASNQAEQQQLTRIQASKLRLLAAEVRIARSAVKTAEVARGAVTVRLEGAVRDAREKQRIYENRKRSRGRGLIDQNQVDLARQQLWTAQDRVRELKRELLNSERTILDAHRAVEQQNLRSPALTLEHARSLARIKAAQRQLVHQQQDLELKHRAALQSQTFELRCEKTSLEKAELDVVQLVQRLDKYRIYAPCAGTVTHLGKRSTSEVVAPDELLALIAPGAARLVVEARVPNREVGALRNKIGGPVKLKFAPFPFRDFGTVQGRLLYVAPDATESEAHGSHYLVRISIDSLRLERGSRRGQVGLGMSVTAEIVKDHPRILSLLFREIRDRVSTG